MARTAEFSQVIISMNRNLGLLREIQQVNTELFGLLFEKGYCPVLTSAHLTTARRGNKLNVNADMAAGL